MGEHQCSGFAAGSLVRFYLSLSRSEAAGVSPCMFHMPERKKAESGDRPASPILRREVSSLFWFLLSHFSSERRRLRPRLGPRLRPGLGVERKQSLPKHFLLWKIEHLQ